MLVGCWLIGLALIVCGFCYVGYGRLGVLT